MINKLKEISFVLAGIAALALIPLALIYRVSADIMKRDNEGGASPVPSLQLTARHNK